MALHPLAHQRHDYSQPGFSESSLSTSPLPLLAQWLDDARQAGLREPNAMALATSFEGRPSCRMVLLKGLEPEGLVFYTNYDSRKGCELTANPWAAATFWWDILERQVRLEGPVTQVPREQSEAYFHSRPRASRIGPAASPQSQPIERADLEARFAKLDAQFPADTLPCPEYWGGYLLLPIRIEFWQGRPSRLHDRLLYTLAPAGDWSLVRLAP
jgi:pyridoxamine 5'-phosphate oxidase